MYYVYDIFGQERVIAKTRDTLYVSIPLNYSLKFQRLTRKDEGRKRCIIIVYFNFDKKSLLVITYANEVTSVCWLFD